VDAPKFIPSIDVVLKAAESLPPADQWRSNTHHIAVNDERLLEFRRVKVKGKLGRTIYRWIYDGKCFVK